MKCSGSLSKEQGMVGRFMNDEIVLKRTPGPSKNKKIIVTWAALSLILIPGWMAESAVACRCWVENNLATETGTTALVGRRDLGRIILFDRTALTLAGEWPTEGARCRICSSEAGSTEESYLAFALGWLVRRM